MISRNIFTDAMMIATLVALQIFVFNRIDIAGKFTPVIYPIFVLFYPFYRNQYVFLFSSFFIGITICFTDFYELIKLSKIFLI